CESQSPPSEIALHQHKSLKKQKKNEDKSNIAKLNKHTDEKSQGDSFKRNKRKTRLPMKLTIGKVVR
ncbi:hypothetical protein SK128_009416, partial [Halocaridina rubra]